MKAIEIRGLDHVVLRVADVPRSLRFYCDVLGCSVEREVGSLTVEFVVTDFAHSLPVEYTGPLPDLFKEGKGVVALGRLEPDGRFVAEEVLAKHDENYMPPEVANALERARGSTESGTETAPQ